MSGSRAASVRSLRVGMVLPNHVVGGVETATLRLCQGLCESGRYQPVVFVRQAGGKLAEFFAERGFPTVRYPAECPSYLHPAPYWRSVFEFRRLLREHRVELVHAADMPAALYAGLASRLAGIPSVCHIRSNFADILTRYKPLFACANRFAFASRAAWANFNRIWAVPPDRGEVVYDWAPEPHRLRDREAVRAEFGIPPGAFLIGMVARLAPPKDHDTLLRACAQLTAANRPVRLLLAGDGDPGELENLRQKVRQLGILEKTVIAGHRYDAQDLMAAMDTHVLCTRDEGFGLVLLESMAVGTPVVASRVGGIPEIVIHNQTGLLHECGNAEDLAAQLTQLANDSRLAARLAAAARDRIATEFTRERTITRIEGIYHRISGWHPGG